MTAARERRSHAQSQPLDANQWTAQVRGELEGLMAQGCDIGQLEALIEKRLKELGRTTKSDQQGKFQFNDVPLGTPVTLDAKGNVSNQNYTGSLENVQASPADAPPPVLIELQ